MQRDRRKARSVEGRGEGWGKVGRVEGWGGLPRLALLLCLPPMFLLLKVTKWIYVGRGNSGEGVVLLLSNRGGITPRVGGRLWGSAYCSQGGI
ncbi:hypothetical protein, partial [Bosea sp. (in: a-proteobacteria)]|uniref:hypothetical protein n=1 Tax=Bosea sp. (in: a-proteobacteria) TaxID=1871050 RepID=UPI004034333F